MSVLFNEAEDGPAEQRGEGPDAFVDLVTELFEANIAGNREVPCSVGGQESLTFCPRERVLLVGLGRGGRLDELLDVAPGGVDEVSNPFAGALQADLHDAVGS